MVVTPFSGGGMYGIRRNNAIRTKCHNLVLHQLAFLGYRINNSQKYSSEEQSQDNERPYHPFLTLEITERSALAAN